MPLLVPGRRLPGLVVFLVTVALATLSVTTRHQLGGMAGLTDEWYYLGGNLRTFGVMGAGFEPFVTRPPGYPAFIAAVLLTVPEPKQATLAADRARAHRVVALAQGLMLGATAWLLHAWMARRLRATTALVAALLFGTSPYSLVLVGLLHYDILHWFVLLASWMTFEWAAAREDDRRPLRMALSGALWGVHTLVRPMIFLVPPLLAVILRRRDRSWRGIVSDGAALALAAALVIAPWTARNHRVTGRFLLVNEQGWAAVWGTAIEKQTFDPNVSQWDRLHAKHFLPLYQRVTGHATYDVRTYNRQHRALSAAFREEAKAALRRRPQVYLHNVARSLATLGLQINTVFLDVFREAQYAHGKSRSPWSFGPDAVPYQPSRLASAFSVFMALLTGLSIVGIVHGLRQRDDWLLVPLAALVSVVLGHALVYMDVMYYYVKVPFLFVFSFYALDALADRWRLPAILALALFGAALLILTLVS